MCILAAIALLFMTPLIKINDVSSRDFRTLRNITFDACEGIEENILAYLEKGDEDFQEELKDNDLPYTKGTVKRRVGELENIAKDLLNDSVSMQELLILSCKAPGIVTDLKNILQTNQLSNLTFHAFASALAAADEELITPDFDLNSCEELLQTSAEDAVDAIGSLVYLTYVLAGLIILFLALAVLAACTHICNKGRWVKYLLLALVLLIIVGVFIATPALSNVVGGAFRDGMNMFEGWADIRLSIAITPFFSVALLVIPIVLDIIFERKKENKQTEG